MITSGMVSNFAAASANCVHSFFGLKPWYAYLQTDKDCNIVKFHVLPGNGPYTGSSDFLLIGLAIIDDLLRIAGLVAVGYIIYGGIMYVMSQGSPDQTSKAQNTVINALIGLVIATVSVALVTFIGNKIG